MKRAQRCGWSLGLVLLASIAFGSSVAGAPYGVLYLEEDGVGAIDLASVHEDGPIVRYEVVSIIRLPTGIADVPDEMHHWKETDCKERSTRLLRMALREANGELQSPPWAEGEKALTEIDTVERRILCERGLYETTVASMEDLRRTLGKRPGS